MNEQYQEGEVIRDAFANEGERTHAMFGHLVGLLSLVDQGTVGLIAAIIMWRVRAKDSPFLDDHGREALNFHISMLILVIVGSIVVSFISCATLLIPWLIAMALLRLIGTIQAAMAAHRGEFFRYPMCYRFLKGPAAAA